MKQFKNIFLLSLMLCICGVVAAGCAKSKMRKAQESLATVVDRVEVPIKMKGSRTITAIYYADNILTLENEMSADSLARMKAEDLQDITLENLRSNLKLRKLINKVVEAQADVRYVYYNGTDSLTFLYTPDELQ